MSRHKKRKLKHHPRAAHKACTRITPCAKHLFFISPASGEDDVRRISTRASPRAPPLLRHVTGDASSRSCGRAISDSPQTVIKKTSLRLPSYLPTWRRLWLPRRQQRRAWAFATSRRASNPPRGRLLVIATSIGLLWRATEASAASAQASEGVVHSHHSRAFKYIVWFYSLFLPFSTDGKHAFTLVIEPS